MLKNAIHIKDFPCHMQGFATDLEKGVMYFSCTDYIIKTDLEGNELKRVRVFGGHLGDICFYEGRVFGTLLGTPKPGDPWNAWTSYVVDIFDEELNLLDQSERVTRIAGRQQRLERIAGFEIQDFQTAPDVILFR